MDSDRHPTRGLGLVLVLALAGCTTGEPPGVAPDASFPEVDAGRPACRPELDADGDGIADDAEKAEDPDGDSLPSFLDIDSDGDGWTDLEEHGTDSPCGAVDSDLDGVPDFLDLDSDNDGLPDAREREAGSDPRVVDSDGDGYSDLIEVEGSRTDPADRSDVVPAADFAIVLPLHGEPVERTLRFSTNLTIADVYFLIDTTASMNAAIQNVRGSIERIAAAIDAAIPDVQLGVGAFEDFAFGTRATTGICGMGDYGCGGDRPYRHVQDVTDRLADVRAALNGLSTRNGGDVPESQAVALHHVVTGEGATYRYDGLPDVEIAPRTCPVVPDELGERHGYPCFRPRALPIVVLVSDARWHGDDLDAAGYAGISPAPATFGTAADALSGIGARFLGVAVLQGSFGAGGALRTPRELAIRTGAVDRDGEPLVYEAQDGEVSDAIVRGIETLATGVPQDVSSRTENVPGNPDGFDATRFIARITPVEAFDRGGVPGPNGGATYTSKDDDGFYSVTPGATVEFEVLFENEVRPEGDTAQIFRAKIFVVGNGVTDLDVRQVYIVVPAAGCGTECLLI